ALGDDAARHISRESLAALEAELREPARVASAQGSREWHFAFCMEGGEPGAKNVPMPRAWNPGLCCWLSGKNRRGPEPPHDQVDRKRGFEDEHRDREDACCAAGLIVG